MNVVFLQRFGHYTGDLVALEAVHKGECWSFIFKGFLDFVYVKYDHILHVLNHNSFVEPVF